jgi:comEA protein
MFDFSRTEIRVILFLVFLLLVGSGMTLYKRFRANQSVDIVSVIEKSTQSKPKSTLDRQAEGSIVKPARENEGSVGDRKDSSAKIDINTAGAYELEGLPGIGPALARRIIEYREKRGDFTTLSDLKRVNGIGDKKLEAIQGYIHIQ